MITESWLAESVSDSQIAIPGYQIIGFDREGRGGGIMIYILDGFTFDLTEFSRYNIANKNMQVNWLSCKPGLRKKIVLGIVYRPPIGNATEFIEYLDETIPNIPNIISHETHLLGDFNIDYLDANLSETKKLKQATIPFGLTQYIDINTRITVETSSCIDLHFTDCKHVENAGVVHLGISDHSLTFIRKKQRPPQNKNSSFLTRSYRNLDEPAFVESIRGIDWSSLIDQQPDIEVAWKAVEMKLGQLLDHQCPIKKVTTHKIRALWMTTQLLAAIKSKDNLMLKALTTRPPDA